MTMLLREENGSQKEKKKFQFENLQKGKREKKWQSGSTTSTAECITGAFFPGCFVTFSLGSNLSTFLFPFLSFSFSFSSAACPLLA